MPSVFLVGLILFSCHCIKQPVVGRFESKTPTDQIIFTFITANDTSEEVAVDTVRIFACGFAGELYKSQCDGALICGDTVCNVVEDTKNINHPSESVARICLRNIVIARIF